MKIFSKTIILYLFSVCVCACVAFAGTLPGGLDDAQPLNCAWELRMTPGIGEAPDSVYVAFGEKLYYVNGSLPPGTTPDDETNFLGIKYGSNFYASLSYRHTDNLSHSWPITICTLDGGECDLAVKGIYGALSAQEHLWLYAEDTLIQELLVAKVGESVSVTVAPGKYVIKYTAEKNFTLTVDGQEETVKYGEAVSKTAAEPAKGYEFTHWAITGLSYETSTANPIEFTMPANDVTLVAQYAAILHTVSETLTLQEGWNLVALPFTELTSATTSDGKSALDAEVYFAQNGKFTKATLADLVGGNAGWIYCENTTTELVLTGQCPEGDASAFPEYSPGRWNFLGVVGKCDAQGQLIVPGESSLPDGAMRWDGTKKAFGDASRTPALYMGYLVK